MHFRGEITVDHPRQNVHEDHLAGRRDQPRVTNRFIRLLQGETALRGLCVSDCQTSSWKDPFLTRNPGGKSWRDSEQIGALLLRMHARVGHTDRRIETRSVF